MRQLTVVRIDEVILHILDPGKNRRGLVYSEIPLPKESDSRIFKYFQDQIEHVLNHEETRAARFKSIQEEKTSGICRALLRADDLDLVTGSKSLAKNLYQIMVASDPGKKRPGKVSAG